MTQALSKDLKSGPMVKGAYYGSFKNWLPESKIADIICAVCAAEWDDEREKHCGKCGEGALYDEAVRNARTWLDLRRKILMKRKA